MLSKVDAKISKWNGKAIMVELAKERDEALPKIGNIGVQLMRGKIQFTNRTWRTRDSIMWVMHNKKSAMGPRAEPQDAITAPRSRRSVLIGSGARAGEEYWKKGTADTIGAGVGIGVARGKWAGAVMLEYGSKDKTRKAYPFIHNTHTELKPQAVAILGSHYQRVIDRIK